MPLRPLLDIPAENAAFAALAAAVRERLDEAGKAGSSEAVEAHISTGIRPFILASLLDDERGLAGRPVLLVTADDRSARDLAVDLRAFLAPRRVRYYPSRGTGYESDRKSVV